MDGDAIEDAKERHAAIKEARFRRRALGWAIEAKAKQIGGKTVTTDDLLQDAMFKVAADAVTAQSPRERARSLSAVASIKLKAMELEAKLTDDSARIVRFEGDPDAGLPKVHPMREVDADAE